MEEHPSSETPRNEGDGNVSKSSILPKAHGTHQGANPPPKVDKQKEKLKENWETGSYSAFQLPGPDSPDEGHSGAIYAMDFTDNFKFLVSGGTDKLIRIWNLESRRLAMAPLSGHSESVLCLQVNEAPEHDVIVSGGKDCHIHFWRFSTGELITRLSLAHDNSILGLHVHNEHFVTCSRDKTIKIWRNPRELSNLNEWSIQNKVARSGIGADFKPLKVLHGHLAAVNAVRIHKNQVFSASGDRTVKIWDIQTGICLRTVIGHTKGIATLYVDSTYILTGGNDNAIRLFERATGEEMACLQGHRKLVRTIHAYLGDLRGKMIVSGSYDETLIVWGTTGTGDWAPRLKLSVHDFQQSSQSSVDEACRQQSPSNLRFDSRRIICSTLDARILIWDFANNDNDIIAGNENFSKVSPPFEPSPPLFAAHKSRIESKITTDTPIVGEDGRQVDMIQPTSTRNKVWLWCKLLITLTKVLSKVCFYLFLVVCQALPRALPDLLSNIMKIVLRIPAITVIICKLILGKAASKLGYSLFTPNRVKVQHGMNNEPRGFQRLWHDFIFEIQSIWGRWKPKCKTCNDLKFSHVPGSPRVLRSGNVALSAQTGCPFCSLLLEGIDLCADTVNLSGDFQIKITTKAPILSVDYGNFKTTTVEFYVYEAERYKSPSFLIGVGRDVTVDLSLDKACDLACYFMDNCLDAHSLLPCWSRERLSLLPTRVIDVGDSELTQIRLHQPVIEERAFYIALSYCWGASTGLKTTRKNLESMKNDIPWESLPRTYRDAIAITRQLGLKYLWIDALCIAQDDAEEWASECAKMGSIYKEAYLTISATSSLDINSGILLDRNAIPPDYRVKKIMFQSNHGSSSSVYIRRALNNGKITNLGMGLSEQYPLFNRGWTLQERLLSTRTLHFTPSEIVWECQGASWCECGSISSGIRSWNTIMYNPKERIGAVNYPALLWEKVVTDFTLRNLTKSSDRLPALSGIAHEFLNEDRGPYLAGLWSKDMPGALCWEASNSTEMLGCLSRYSGKRIGRPTWSWASVDCPVSWESNGIYDHWESVVHSWEAHCTPSTSDPLGQVEHGELKICAPVIEAHMKPVVPSRRSQKVMVQFNDENMEVASDVGSRLLSQGLVAQETELDHENEDLQEQDVLCLQLSKEPDTGEWVALVLRRSKPVKKAYERLAIISTPTVRLLSGSDIKVDWFKDASLRSVLIV